MNNQLSNIKECESKSDEPIIWTLVTSAMLLLLIEIAEMVGFSLYDRILPVNTQKDTKNISDGMIVYQLLLGNNALSDLHRMLQRFCVN